MANPEQRVGFEPGPGCSNLIGTITQKVRNSRLFSGQRSRDEWPTVKRVKGTGSPDLDRQISDRFQDTQF